MRFAFKFLYVVWLISCNVIASPGDNLAEFTDCVRTCENKRNCLGKSSDPANSFIDRKFEETALIYKLLFWDCSSDCDYQCQQIITTMRIAENKKVYQFHGKWPFKRLLGLQEFYSTIFSIGNFVPHYKGLKLLLSALKRIPEADKTRIVLKNYLYVALAGMLAWFCSSIFHTRDLIVTEKMDYFFAGATVLTGFHAIFIRVTRLDQSPRMAKLFSLCVLLIFSLHILRLYLDWSYTYNMRFNIFFGLLQYVLLVILAISNYKNLKASEKGLVYDLSIVPIGMVAFTALAMSSELLDFFNYEWQIDSHAIWHALTIAPSCYLYTFFLKDYQHLRTSIFSSIKEV